MFAPNAEKQSAKNILKPIKDSPLSIHWKLLSKLILHLVSFSVYPWVMEWTRPLSPMNDDLLTPLVKKPIIYFLFTFEASTLENNSEFSTVFFHLLNVMTMTTHLPVTPEVIVTFRPLWRHQIPQMHPSYKAHDVLSKLKKRGEVIRQEKKVPP